MRSQRPPGFRSVLPATISPDAICRPTASSCSGFSTSAGRKTPRRRAQWQQALTRARGPPGRRTNNPYRGLARFEAEDAGRFFGREDITELLVSLAAESSPVPLVLVGPSGAGKSSLLRAACCPGSSPWRRPLPASPDR